MKKLLMRSNDTSDVTLHFARLRHGVRRSSIGSHGRIHSICKIKPRGKAMQHKWGSDWQPLKDARSDRKMFIKQIDKIVQIRRRARGLHLDSIS